MQMLTKKKKKKKTTRLTLKRNLFLFCCVALMRKSTKSLLLFATNDVLQANIAVDFSFIITVKYRSTICYSTGGVTVHI